MKISPLFIGLFLLWGYGSWVLWGSSLEKDWSSKFELKYDLKYNLIQLSDSSKPNLEHLNKNVELQFSTVTTPQLVDFETNSIFPEGTIYFHRITEYCQWMESVRYEKNPKTNISEPHYSYEKHWHYYQIPSPSFKYSLSHMVIQMI